MPPVRTSMLNLPTRISRSQFFCNHWPPSLGAEAGNSSTPAPPAPPPASSRHEVITHIRVGILPADWPRPILHQVFLPSPKLCGAVGLQKKPASRAGPQDRLQLRSPCPEGPYEGPSTRATLPSIVPAGALSLATTCVPSSQEHDSSQRKLMEELSRLGQSSA